MKNLPFDRNGFSFNRSIASYLAGVWQTIENLSTHSESPLSLSDASHNPSNTSNCDTQIYTKVHIAKNGHHAKGGI